MPPTLGNVRMLVVKTMASMTRPARTSILVKRFPGASSISVGTPGIVWSGCLGAQCCPYRNWILKTGKTTFIRSLKLWRHAMEQFALPLWGKSTGYRYHRWFLSQSVRKSAPMMLGLLNTDANKTTGDNSKSIYVWVRHNFCCITTAAFHRSRWLVKVTRHV